MQLKGQDFKFKAAQAQAISELIQKKNEFRKLEMDDDEPDRLVGDHEAKHPNVDNYRIGKTNKISSNYRKARAKNKPMAAEIEAAKEKLASESGKQVEAVWPDEMFEGG